SGSGPDRKEQQADRKEGEASARANRLWVLAHVPRVKQRDSQGQGTTSHAEID
ncbi:MAG: hypothetical protein K0S78_6163, partial [Thermomicrobiales bacterium]|nr:hypothetical protein [Thermomicrobiales bacterium]